MKSEATRTVSSDLLQRKDFSKRLTIEEDIFSLSQTCVKRRIGTVEGEGFTQ